MISTLFGGSLNLQLIKKLLLVILVIYLLNGVYLSQFVLNVIKPAIVVRTHPEGFYDYSGVLNIQSVRSTGSGTYLDIIQDAQSSGLDFIFVNDFNDTNPDKTFERYYDHLLVFIDSEFKYLDSNVLFYGRNDYSEFTSAGQTQALLADLLSNESHYQGENGLPVLAHPFKNGHEWAGRLPSGFHGIEVINLKSIWQSVWQENKPSFLWSVFIYPFNPELALVRMFPFPNREIQLWDELNNNKQKTFAYAGADADGKIKFPKDFKLPSYETLFNIVRTHVLLDSELTGDFNTDSKKIKKSLCLTQTRAWI